MFRKSIVLALALSLLHFGSRPVFAASRQDEEARRLAKVKADVAKRGIGEKAHIKVKLQNKTEVRIRLSSRRG